MNLRRGFERFCYRNRDKGIPNLMLYIVLGSALVYLMSMVDNSDTLYYALCFDRSAILRGQIWRLVTYVFTYNAGSVLFTAISLFCYYSLGRAVEYAWGTFRFNLFYLTGVVLQDTFSMVFGGAARVGYLNLSLLLAYATLYPNASFLLFYIIPVKAWIFGLLDLGLTLYDVIQLRHFFPYNLFPLVAIANYFLFFGKDVLNLLPMSWRVRRAKQKPQRATITFTRPEPGPYAAKNAQNYTHRCAVCGRTDVSNPELEFRYCSRCNGYHCYCQDHINNHNHIE